MLYQKKQKKLDAKELEVDRPKNKISAANLKTDPYRNDPLNETKLSERTAVTRPVYGNFTTDYKMEYPPTSKTNKALYATTSANEPSATLTPERLDSIQIDSELDSVEQENFEVKSVRNPAVTYAAQVNVN